MSDDENMPKRVVEKLEEYIEQQDVDVEAQVRNRHKYWLLNKWRTALDKYDGPGEAVLVDGYRPSGFQAPIDVPEIAELIIQDPENHVYHFRLKRDETADFIEMPDDPDAPIIIDPISSPASNSDRFLSLGVPDAVTAVFEALDLTGPWDRACPAGTHTPEVINADSKCEFVACKRCELPRRTLTWIGHDVLMPTRKHESEE